MRSFQPKPEAAPPGGDRPDDPPSPQPATRHPPPATRHPPPAAAAADADAETCPETTEKPGDRNAEVDFRGQKRSNATHASLTDPEARLYKKSPGTGANLCFIGHTLMDQAGSTTGPRNPPQGNGLIVQTGMTQADDHAGRRAALAMIHRQSLGSTRRRHDLLRRLFKANRRQPVRARLRPTLFAGIEPAVPQPEPLQMLQHLARNAHRRCPRPDVARAQTRSCIASWAASRTRTAVNSPARCSFASMRAPAPVGLYPVARLHRNARGRGDHAVVARFAELPVQAVAARSGLMADMKPAPIAPKLVGKLADMIGAVRDCAPVPHFTAPLALRKRHRNRGLMDIQPDKHDILQLVSPPFLRLGASQSGATLTGE
jgi:hypothetical protein